MEEKDLNIGIELEGDETEEISSPISHNYNYSYTDVFELEDVNERRFLINSDIDEGVIDTIGYHIMRCNRLDKGIAVNEREPIILYINTDGGQVSAGYSIIDIIKTSLTPVYTVNLGKCYSMGFLIAIAGHKRYCMPSATYLMHDGSNFGYDSTAKLKDRIDFETGQVEEYTKQYVLSNTKISKSVYDKKYRIEWYMYGEEAKKYGVVDYIVGKDCTLDEILN